MDRNNLIKVKNIHNERMERKSKTSMKQFFLHNHSVNWIGGYSVFWPSSGQWHKKYSKTCTYHEVEESQSLSLQRPWPSSLRGQPPNYWSTPPEDSLRARKLQPPLNFRNSPHPKMSPEILATWKHYWWVTLILRQQFLRKEEKDQREQENQNKENSLTQEWDEG